MRPLLLFASADPQQYERLPERHYVGPIHTLALVYDDDELRRRLTARPTWRASGDESFHASMLQFNRSLADRETDRVALLDTTRDAPAVSASRVAAWARTLMEDGT